MCQNLKHHWKFYNYKHMSEHLMQFRDVFYECECVWKDRHDFEDTGILYKSSKITANPEYYTACSSDLQPFPEQGSWNYMIFKGFFQPRPFYDSMKNS